MTEKKRKRAREHAAKHGMSYQAAFQQLNHEPPSTGPEALEFWSWCAYMDEAGRGACLTIADVLAMQKGERVEVLVMDRNLCDHVCKATPKPAEPPEIFFEKARDGAVYIHGEGLTGMIEWGWSAPKAGDLPVTVTFEFHIEYEPGYWYPLTDGYLPKSDPQGISLFSYPEPRHWSTFPETTRVGWRGPMVRWSKLDQQPSVFTWLSADLEATQALLPILVQALGVSKKRLWLTREGSQWVLYVQDLTPQERRSFTGRLRDVTVRAGWRKPKATMVCGFPKVGPLLEWLSTEKGRQEILLDFNCHVSEHGDWYSSFGVAVHDYFRGVIDEDPENVRKVVELIVWPEGAQIMSFEELFAV